MQAQVGFRNFTSFHLERLEEIKAAVKQSKKVEERARQERATYEKYNYLHQAMAAVADKDQEIAAKNEVFMIGVEGANPGEGLKVKDNGDSPSHTAL